MTALYQVLLTSDREIGLAIPIQMDNGRLKVFQAYRVQHDLARGPSHGGIRHAPDVTLDQIRALAAWMTWKCAVVREGSPAIRKRLGHIIADVPHHLSTGMNQRPSIAKFPTPRGGALGRSGFPGAKTGICSAGTSGSMPTPTGFSASEGEPAKIPSWRLREMLMALFYGDVGGMRLQTALGHCPDNSAPTRSFHAT